MSDLTSFVRESNAIEGIYPPSQRGDEMATEAFLAAEEMTVAALSEFVRSAARAELRSAPGMDVRVGDHVAPAGGPEVVRSLEAIVERANADEDPYNVHLAYETLHPFTDGNGRSGRALWLWMMLRQHRTIAPMGFLQSWYYETLRRSRSADAPDGS